LEIAGSQSFLKTRSLCTGPSLTVGLLTRPLTEVAAQRSFRVSLLITKGDDATKLLDQRVTHHRCAVENK
jgi:hypothetical protein